MLIYIYAYILFMGQYVPPPMIKLLLINLIFVVKFNYLVDFIKLINKI